MKESDIRPNNLMTEQSKRFKLDIKNLLKHKEKFVYIKCPACECTTNTKNFEKGGFKYVICNNCGTMYINPRPTIQMLENYYKTSENYKYWNEYIFPLSEKSRIEKIIYPRIDKIINICNKNNVNKETFIEVGAGFGSFCEEINKLKIFKNIIAIEPTPSLAESCRNKGIKTVELPIEQVFLVKNSIDVITGFEIIEHLFCPKDFIMKCANSLSNNGLLVMTCPNINGFDIKVLKNISDSIDIEHLNYFNPNSISILIQNCGLKILEITTPGELDVEIVRKKIISNEFDISTQPFLKQILIDEWDRLGEKFQQFLKNNLLSSHMWIVARKEE